MHTCDYKIFYWKKEAKVKLDMMLSTSGSVHQGHEEVEKKCLNSELWHACAGPLVSLPTAGTRVVYFPQGHSEQVAATTNREVDGHIPNYPSLLPQLICQLHNVTMHADVETDEVYAQMTLQPLTPQGQKETFLPMELGITSKRPSNYFCKILTASDTSTHGGFSVPRRAAEKVFPSLDYSQQPPAQELIARDLHDVEWKFRHVFRGQPKRHLLTTGWSVFVSSKRLVTGDSVLFIWNEKNQLLLGIRRANRPQTLIPSSVLSNDSMHIGLLAAAAHAAATNSCFTVFYNPRACPSEFVIPLSKYIKAVYHTCVSVGLRFRMLFETDESSVRRYMGTITGISDLDPVRWPNSHWRSVKVGWDESTAGETQPRVSLWEVEPLTTFPMYPLLFPPSFKRPCYPSPLSVNGGRDDATNGLMWRSGGAGEHNFNSLNFQSGGVFPWMQQSLDPALSGNNYNQHNQALLAAGLQNPGSRDLLRQPMLHFQQSFPFLQQSGNHNLSLQLQQKQAIQQSVSSNIMQPQAHVLTENLSQNLLQKPLNINNQEDQAHQQNNTCHDSLSIQNDQFHQRQESNVPSPSFTKPDFLDSSTKFSSSVSPIQNVLGSLCPEGSSSDILNLSRPGQSMVTEQMPQQSWTSKYPTVQVSAFGNLASQAQYSGKDSASAPPHCTSDDQNPTLFCNIDSSGLVLPTTVPDYTPSSVDTDTSTMQIGNSGFQGHPYACMQDSSELLQSSGQVYSQNQTQTFVKVYKSGSVGRSLDISRFSCYHELKEELAQMFGIEGEDPRRSGWQLVFVDRENDMLLLGDDPWESFVNNVWYIKILSPEDIQKMGDQVAGLESLGPYAG